MEQQNSRDLKWLLENAKIKNKSIFLSNKIVEWYLIHGRKFPWRSSKATPYEKLIAEILLQKTRAENVVEIYKKFIKKYPSFDSVLSAKNEDLIILLKPLGLYNNRTISIKKCAKKIMSTYNGEIPKKQEDILKIHGIGPYITNAYLISQYGMKLAVVDTNFKRIFSRFYSVKMEGDPRRNHFIIKFAEFVLPKKNIKEYTFGIIDFAAIICKNKTPKCNNCILKNECDFYNDFKAKSNL